MLRLKPGVRVSEMCPQIVLAALVADGIYHDYGLECIVTSVRYGTHMKNSLHYVGKAMDLRTRNLPTEDSKHTVARRLSLALGDDYDVVLEGLGTPHQHIHVEFDPK